MKTEQVSSKQHIRSDERPCEELLDDMECLHDWKQPHEAAKQGRLRHPIRIKPSSVMTVLIPLPAHCLIKFAGLEASAP